MAIGDADWVLANGRMSELERWRYTLFAIRERLRLLTTPIGPPVHNVDLDRIVRPDTAFARAAEEKIRALASPALANHSLRTYVWGSLLGQIDRKRWDAEILWGASMLHDLGFTEALHGSARDACCFTLDAVRGAEDVFEATTPERAAMVVRAIALHVNVAVPGDMHGWEAHYVRAGAALDVIGQRYSEIPPSAARAVLATHPRLDLKRELAAWIRREARSRPRSRMSILRRLGLPTLVRRAPFES